MLVPFPVSGRVSDWLRDQPLSQVVGPLRCRLVGGLVAVPVVRTVVYEVGSLVIYLNGRILSDSPCPDQNLPGEEHSFEKWTPLHPADEVRDGQRPDDPEHQQSDGADEHIPIPRDHSHEEGGGKGQSQWPEHEFRRPFSDLVLLLLVIPLS